MANQHPSLVYMSVLTDKDQPQASVCIKTGRGDKWVPARGMGSSSLRSRLRLAWMVFTGKADALLWEDQ
jgi:hypothetical protein